MKRHILPLLLVLAGTAAFSGCSKGELPDTAPAGGNIPAVPFTVTITDGGYAPADAHPHTRTAEEDYKTKFTTGDRIGVFAVKDGNIIVDNLCLIAQTGSNGNIEWQREEGALQLTTDATYYAYYPHQPALTAELVPTATTAAGFFANLISNWTPDADQSTYTKYTAQDLMVAKGTVSHKNLSFSMQHQMAMAVIELPKRKYTFTNATSPIPDYLIGPSGTQFTGNFTPYPISSGTYRYVVKPATAVSFSGSYNDGGTRHWSIPSSTVRAGSYKVFRVDGATVTGISHTLAAGDFYMKDGSLIAGSTAALTPEQQAACIGVVFWVGDATAQDRTLKADHPACTHGLVVALKDVAEGKFEWQYPGVSVQEWLNNNLPDQFLKVESGQGASDPLNNIQGYNNTKAIEAFNEKSGLSLVQPVVDVVDYRKNDVIAPVHSSDWYFPSAKELTLLCGRDVPDIYNNSPVGTDTRDLLNGIGQTLGQFDKLGDFAEKIVFDVYWSSTEVSNDGVLRVGFYVGDLYASYKSLTSNVRYILAF